MDIPEDIKNIINKIKNSEKEWKALYMGIWLGVYRLENEFKKSNEWEKVISFSLPGAKDGYYNYIPKELHKILKGQDRLFTLTHLQILFSLLEDLVFESNYKLFNKEVRMGNWTKIEEFLESINLSEKNIKELCLAKKTRNCFIHNNSKIDKEWVKSYKSARKKDLKKLLGKDLSEGFDSLLQEVEGWNSLIVEISDIIKKELENNSNI
jgi:hypothetical protein